MRVTSLLAASLLLIANAYAGEGKATAQGVTEEFATGEAMRLVPKGATVTDTQCRTINVAEDTRYQCTLTYSK